MSLIFNRYTISLTITVYFLQPYCNESILFLICAIIWLAIDYHKFFIHNTFEDAIQQESKHCVLADNETYTYVYNCLSQMADVNATNINLHIYVGSTRGGINAGVTVASLCSQYYTAYLWLYNFKIPSHASPIHKARERLQYMTLAHEMGHVYNNDFQKRSYNLFFSILCASTLYPLALILTNYISFSSNEPQMCMLLPTRILQCTVTSMVYSRYCRQQEHQADIFAAQQARDAYDLRLHEHVFKRIARKNPMHKITHLFEKHPPAQDRYEHIHAFRTSQDYQQPNKHHTTTINP